MASVKDQKTLSANLILIKVGSKIIGRAQSLSSERSFGTTGVYEIGSIMPQEHIYLRYEGTVTLNRFRLRKEDLVTIGLGALGEDVLQMDVFDIMLVDSSNNTVIETFVGCSIDTLSMTNNATEVTSEEARFFYLTASKTTKV